MSRRRLAIAAAGLLAGGVAVVLVISGDGSTAPHPRHRVSAPPDPRVVAPRLIQELHGPVLTFWIRTVTARTRGKVVQRWTTEGSGSNWRVSLALVTASPRHTRLAKATWHISVPLDRPPSGSQVRSLVGGRGVVPANSTARRFSTLPRLSPPRAGESVELPSRALVLGRGAKLEHLVIPRRAMDPRWVIRDGRDLALLRGEGLLGNRPSIPMRLQRLVPHAEIRFQGKMLSRPQLVRLLARYQGAIVVLRWRARQNERLGELLRQPIEGIVVLEP